MRATPAKFTSDGGLLAVLLKALELGSRIDHLTSSSG